jgi:hypothetical protein
MIFYSLKILSTCHVAYSYYFMRQRRREKHGFRLRDAFHLREYGYGGQDGGQAGFRVLSVTTRLPTATADCYSGRRSLGEGGCRSTRRPYVRLR